jgi:hypothetical protein
MKRVFDSLIFITTIFFLFSLSTINVNAKDSGQAGVGVLSAPPQYSIIRLVQHDQHIRAYITVSDINSWEDIYSVSIILKDNDAEKAEFRFQQYEDQESWEKINVFNELPKENNFLVIEKCSYNNLNIEEVLEDCYLNLIFVFQSTHFTHLDIIANDRGGAISTLELDYSSQDISRSGNIVIIPGFDKPISIEMPGYILDIIALCIATIGTWYLVKKKKIGNLMRALNEKE